MSKSGFLTENDQIGKIMFHPYKCIECKMFQKIKKSYKSTFCSEIVYSMPWLMSLVQAKYNYCYFTYSLYLSYSKDNNGKNICFSKLTTIEGNKCFLWELF